MRTLAIATAAALALFAVAQIASPPASAQPLPCGACPAPTDAAKMGIYNRCLHCYRPPWWRR